MRLLTCSWTRRGLWCLCLAHIQSSSANRRQESCLRLSWNTSVCPADCQCSPIPKKMKLFQMQFVAPLEKKKKAKPLARNRPKSRQHIIHYRKYKCLMQFYRQLEGAKFASPHNRLQIFLWKTKKKLKKKNRQGEGWTTAPLSDPQTLGTSAVAAGKKGPLIPRSVATRNTAIFSHVFQPLLLFLPAEQPFGRWSGLEIQTEMKRYQPMQNSERDIHSSTKLMIKPWWKSLPE